MKINLKTAAKQSVEKSVIQLRERLPERIHPPSELSLNFQVTCNDNYYLLKLDVFGTLTITCQRCLKAFQYTYSNTTELAICMNDNVAETLMEQWECIVADNNEIDLVEILTDEIHLYAPEKHENSIDCDEEMSPWLTDKNENMPVTLGL